MSVVDAEPPAGKPGLKVTNQLHPIFAEDAGTSEAEEMQETAVMQMAQVEEAPRFDSMAPSLALNRERHRLSICALGTQVSSVQILPRAARRPRQLMSRPATPLPAGLSVNLRPVTSIKHLGRTFVDATFSSSNL